MSNNKDKRKFIASSELFSNFEVEISLYSISNIEDIIKIFKDELINLFSKNKLVNLIKKVEEANFHIHSNSIEDILTSESEAIFYVCDHC